MIFFIPIPILGLEPFDDEEGEGIVLRSQYPWEGTTRDYYYEEVRFLEFSPLPLAQYTAKLQYEVKPHHKSLQQNV